jgi:hypothetical protein
LVESKLGVADGNVDCGIMGVTGKPDAVSPG